LINGYGYNDVLLGRQPNRRDWDKVSTTQSTVMKKKIRGFVFTSILGE
jgi:hypothetical protein